MTTQTTHIVIGSGEVGTALYSVLSDTFGNRVQIRDIDPLDAVADVLHVCIPWSAKFVDIVHEYTRIHQASTVVVHSTVPVGTCDAQGWVHSPIRGRHPNLREGVETFVKHVGGLRAAEVADTFRRAGIRCIVHASAAVTEAGKLWELVQFGIQVSIQKDIYEWCEERGLNGDEVYRSFAHTYNSGYAELSEDRFVRPVIDHEPSDKIGGHCVTQNAVHLDSPWAKMVADR